MNRIDNRNQNPINYFSVIFCELVQKSRLLDSGKHFQPSLIFKGGRGQQIGYLGYLWKG
jgi:hypothetical protein